MNPPAPHNAPAGYCEEHGLAVIGERVAGLAARFEDHVEADRLFQDQMRDIHLDTQRTLKSIELKLAGWKGTAVSAVAAVSAVWAIVVVVLTWWKG